MINMDWKSKRIADLGEVITGTTPPTKNPKYYGDKYPFITPSDMLESQRSITTQRYLSEEGFRKFHSRALPKNSVCYTCIASLGKMGITKEISLTNQQINSIIVNEKHNPLFVYYLLMHNRKRINLRASGVAVPIINKSIFSSIKVKVPPKRNQTRITNILSPLDDLIEVNLRRIKILEEIAKILYNEWFVHFRYPGHENAEIIQKPQGSTPKGWNWSNLFDIADVTFGNAFKSKYFNKEFEGFTG